jgi:hypothetical protein
MAGRLAHHCQAHNLAPSFGPAERDMLLHALDGVIADPVMMVNSGLKNLGKMSARHPELNLAVCPRILTPSEAARQEKKDEFGQDFSASIASYVAVMSTPTGRTAKVNKSIARKHPAALRLAARHCAAAGIPPTTVTDLLSEASRDAIIDAYGDSGQASGGRKKLMSLLLSVARYAQDKAARKAIKTQIASMGKCADGLPLARLQALARFNDVRVRDREITKIAAVAVETGSGWPALWPLRRLQGGFAALFCYYAIATPGFVYSLGFDLAGPRRQTPWGPRPLLMARDAPHEPVERRFPEKFLVLVDIYWAQMPDELRAAGEFFVTDDGDRMKPSAFVRRLQMILAELGTGLTPLGLADLAVSDMIWDGTMSDAEMALAARFVSERNFLKRYQVLINAIATLRRKQKRRPGTAP